MKLTIAGCLTFLLVAALPRLPSPLADAEWLIGTWENHTPRGTIYEEWRRTSSIQFDAMSFAVANGDTTIFETIRLVETDGGLMYIATVHSQNEGRPVVFRSTNVTDSTMSFANPDHDFPNYISYARVGSDSLVADIYGTTDGADRRYSFRMRRVTPRAE
jgi:hypothetical protein